MKAKVKNLEVVEAFSITIFHVHQADSVLTLFCKLCAPLMLLCFVVTHLTWVTLLNLENLKVVIFNILA